MPFEYEHYNISRDVCPFRYNSVVTLDLNSYLTACKMKDKWKQMN